MHVQVTAPHWEPGGLIALFPRLAYWRARHLLSNIRLTKTHFAGRFPWILLQNKVVVPHFFTFTAAAGGNWTTLAPP